MPTCARMVLLAQQPASTRKTLTLHFNAPVHQATPEVIVKTVRVILIIV